MTRQTQSSIKASTTIAPATEANLGIKALKGVRVLSLALNLPGPAALQRLRTMGANCTKLEPPGVGDPMAHYNTQAYGELHEGIKVLTADLKAPEGQRALHKALAKTDILLTSFRPAALKRLGLGWKELHKDYPGLSMVRVVGAPGPEADLAGHDLTYMAEAGLVPSLALPPTLYADMAGSLLASEAALQVMLRRQSSGKGSEMEVALSEAAQWLGLPRRWGMTQPKGVVGGAHAGYQVYACIKGRVAVAALEPHFAQRLCEAAGLRAGAHLKMTSPATRKALESFFAGKSRREVDALAKAADLPVHTLPPGR
ncbi:CaiB/BaiF CoA-transferase family protein [Hydrogenophaga sp. 5NK40-0174]|uniref:CaiB/BaiF CoA-transferase family protein n=1 Tax=Hydrogenophaga sp. 5NK40-0174 TaxID=3127649 RepID=UPI003105AC37